jgi:hypothetical protein
MKHFQNLQFIGKGMIIFITILTMSSCDRSSSPEGRMSIKIESLQKQMIDSLAQQNRAILDSLSKIRTELNELKQGKK